MPDNNVKGKRKTIYLTQREHDAIEAASEHEHTSFSYQLRRAWHTYNAHRKGTT